MGAARGSAIGDHIDSGAWVYAGGDGNPASLPPRLASHERLRQEVPFIAAEPRAVGRNEVFEIEARADARANREILSAIEVGVDAGQIPVRLVEPEPVGLTLIEVIPVDAIPPSRVVLVDDARGRAVSNGIPLHDI